MDPIYAQADQLQTDQDFQKAYGVYSFYFNFAMHLLFFVHIDLFCSWDKHIFILLMYSQ